MAVLTDPPGTYSTEVTGQASAPAAPAIGTAAYCGLTERGPTDRAIWITSNASFKAWFGNQIGTSILPDAVEVHFREGGGPIYVARNLGTGAVKASVTVAAASGTALTVTAQNAGAWANGYTLDSVWTGSNVALVMKDSTGLIVEQTPSAAPSAAVTALANSKWMNATLGAGTGAGTTALAAAFTAGANGTTSDATALATLALLTPDLGPMAVYFPGDTATTRRAQVIAACLPGDGPLRVPVIDFVDATATTSAASITGLWTTTGADKAVCCVSIGITPDGRQIPWGVVWCAHASRLDRTKAPGTAVAAGNSVCQYITSVLRLFPVKSDRFALDQAGATVAILDDPDGLGIRRPMTFSDRTASDLTDKTKVHESSDVRVLMWVDAAVRYALRPYRFSPIVPTVLASIKGDCANLGTGLYAAGTISDDPGDGTGSTGKYSDAFGIEVSGDPTTKTISVNALVRPSPGAAIQRVAVIRQSAEG